MPADYRARIYSRYASVFKDQTTNFNADAAKKWGRPYDKYFSGWLPVDHRSAIADVACGGGGLLYFFQQRGFQNISGVDVSPEQVALARQVVPAVQEQGVQQFLSANLERFDLLTALDLVEHLTKDEMFEFLDGCYAALKPGGRLILQTVNGECPWAGHIRYGDFTHETAFTADSLKRLLKLCGFDRTAVRECAPVVGRPVSTIRAVLWRLQRLQYMFANAVETGSIGSGVYTRVFLATGVRK